MMNLYSNRMRRSRKTLGIPEAWILIYCRKARSFRQSLRKTAPSIKGAPSPTCSMAKPLNWQKPQICPVGLPMPWLVVATQAAALLEQGRARGLSETLDRDRSNLSQLQDTHPTLFNQYQKITTQLRNLEAQQRSRMTSEERHSLTPEAFRTEALQLRQTLTEAIEQIRQVEGYTDFLAQPDFNDIQTSCSLWRSSGVPCAYPKRKPRPHRYPKMALRISG